ncbi:MAG: hypothetical protein AB7F86_00060 [Bdellovibrionales bacterium]
MSSVGSSDSSNRQDETIRRNREEYRQNESEAIKKHQKELRRLNEKHYAEMEKLKESHNEQMKSMRGASREAISERDMRYQQEIEDLRQMHRKQLQNFADESRTREENLQKATKSDQTQQKDQSDSRFQKLNEDYATSRADQEKRFQEALQLTREDQARALEANRKSQEAYHQREVGAVKDERNKTVSNLQNQYRTYRDDAEKRIKGQEVKHMQENQRSSANLVRAVQRERVNRVQGEEILRDGFEDGLASTRDRFERAREKDREANSMVRDQLKTSVNDRVDGQVHRLENENEDLKDLNIRRELELKNKQKRELDNLKRAFMANLENMEDQRNEAVRQSNDRSRDDVLSVRKDMGKQLMDTNRFYRERMEDQNRINRTAYENIVDDFKNRNDHTKNQADQRVMKLYEETEGQKVRMIEQQAEMHEASQRQKQDEIKQVAQIKDEEKNQAIQRMKDQLQKQELQHSDKMNQTVSKYEKQIQMLKDQMVRDKRANEEYMRRTVEAIQRNHKMEMDQLQARNMDQMRQSQVRHDQEVSTMNKRHEQKLDQVLTEVKKT